MKGYQPFAGYNWGARNYRRVREATITCMKWTTGFCILWIGVILLFVRPLTEGFSNDPMVVDYAVKALILNTMMFFTFGFQFSFSSLHLALGKAGPGMLLNTSRQGLFFLPVILILHHLLGLDGVMVAQAVTDVCTTLLTIGFAVRIWREIHTAEQKQTAATGYA